MPELVQLESQRYALFAVQSPEEVLKEAIATYSPVKVFALFSGGNDSLTTTHYAMSHGAEEVVHVNTGIGIKETREYVRYTCKKYGWPLRELFPPDKTYEQFVLEHGFPGPQAHRYAYSWLKERSLRKLIQEVKVQYSDKVGLVTGVRNLESARRMGYVKPIHKDGAAVWIAPMFSYSKIDLANYRKEFNLEQSPVVEKFGMSGECLCGAFAHEGEIGEIETHFPDVAEEIHNLEAKVRACGKNIPCVWGHGGDVELDEEEDEYNLFSPMCVGCNETKRRQNA